MSDNIFSRLFSYRERENISPLENYCIEILAYCLQADKEFQQDFFKTVVKTILVGEPAIETQKIFGTDRPDIFIEADNEILLIEVKVESSEGADQLASYYRILSELIDQRSRRLVYLTKYCDPKDYVLDGVKFTPVRWYQIYDIIGDKNLAITQEFKTFLKTKGMSDVPEFNLHELSALLNISSAIKKMDELLDIFKPEFNKLFGGYSDYGSRSTSLRESYYSCKCYLNGKEPYTLWLSFAWDGEDMPRLGLDLDFSATSPDFLTLKDSFIGKGWIESGEKRRYLSYSSPLSRFLNTDTGQLKAMENYIRTGLAEIQSVSDEMGFIFTK